MNQLAKNVSFLVFIFLFQYLAGACENKDRVNISDMDVYYNPVVAKSLPDPTIIKAADGWFYLYATEDIRNTPIHKSKDLVNWEFVGTAFTNETRPDFEPKGGLWAPDINYIGGKSTDA